MTNLFQLPQERPNYIGAVNDYESGRIMVFTRDGDERRAEWFDPPYYFYSPDENGEYMSMYGDKCDKFEFDSKIEFEEAKKLPIKKFESDISPLDKVLIDNFYGLPTPTVYYAFLDIEVDYDSNIGFSRPSNPYAPVNAVTIYKSWNKQYVTIVVPPKSWDGTIPTHEMIRAHDVHVDPELIIAKNEAELLDLMLTHLESADIVSGWNSDFFDMPYLVKRVEMVLGKRATSRFCFRGCRYPKEKMVSRFGTEELTYQFFGRSHLDYLQLFKKFTFEGRTSYALGSILEDEVHINKLEYDGTLEQLYNNDFNRFIAYNIRDVEGLVKLDEKFKFISLVNQMAHENTVLFDAILGTVKYVETGITGYAHYVMQQVVQDKVVMTDGEKVEGAIVLTPRKGLHRWIGSVDINSLYPNTIRALNISPEMLIGQFTNGENDWRGIKNGDDENHILETDKGDEYHGTGAEWQEILKARKWAITGYGTVFDQSRGPGILPTILGDWYSSRKKLQAEKKKYGKLYKEETDPVKKEEFRVLEELYDLLQLTKKIAMNSMYGALLNAAFRLGRKELGASVTGSGRQITTHMMATISQFFTGVYSEPIKTTEIDDDGKVQNIYITDEISPVIYGDTDSAYVVLPADQKNDAVEMADLMASFVNDSFPQFMKDVFFVQDEFSDLIKAGREIVAERGLFQAKKKYICKVVDLEGTPVIKLKSQGSEIKKSDTPKVIQRFLTEVLSKILDGDEYSAVEDYIINQRDNLIKNASSTNIISMGVNKQVNKLDSFYEEWKRLEKTGKKKVNLPGHVRASVNYNEAVLHYEGNGAQLLKAGDKVIIFYLKPNEWKFKAIAFPAEMTKFPKWFLETFIVDTKLTEEKMIDQKLKGIFSAINWEVPDKQTRLTNSLLEY